MKSRFSPFPQRLASMAVLLAAAVLAACGGGSGASTQTSTGPVTPPVTPPVITPPTITEPSAPPAAEVMTFQGSAESDALAELKASSRSLQALALLNDPLRKQVIASVNQASGNTLVGLDPVSLQTLWSMPAPSYMSRLVMADDGATLYALLPNQQAVWQVDLSRRAAVRTIAMADGASPLALSVRPGRAGTIVVATGRPDLVSPFQRLQAYDNGVPRPDWLAGGHGASWPLNEIQFISPDTLIALDTQTSGCARQRVRLGDTGLSVTDVFYGFSSCYTDRLEMPAAGRLLTRQGIEFDPASLQILSLKPVTRSYDSQLSNAGFGILHSGMKSYLQLSTDTITSSAYHRVRVDEYTDAGREYMKRHLSVTSDVRLELTGSRPDTIVIDAVPVEASRVVAAVYDDNARNPEVMLLSFDLSTSAPLPDWDFAMRSSKTASASGWVLRAPLSATAYDPELGRLIGVAPLAMGPSGNALVVIHPDSGAVERTIPLQAEAGVFAVSAQGSIAYVGMKGKRQLQKIDLKTGSVLATLKNVLVTELLIKPGDPHTVALKTVSEKADYILTSYNTAKGTFIAAPAIIDNRLDISTGYLDLLGVSSAGEIIGFEELSTTNVWHLKWDAAGLTAASVQPNSKLGLGGPRPKMGFDRLISSMAMVDLPTAARVATFSGITYDYVLTSANSVALLVYDQANYAPMLQWRRAPTTPNAEGKWDTVGSLTILDKAFLPNISRSDSYHAEAGAPGQIVVRQYATGGFMGAFEAYRGYVYGIKSN